MSSSSSKGRGSSKSFTFVPFVQCQEVSGLEYDVRVCVTVPHPLGTEIAEFKKTKLFTARRIKITLTITTNEAMSTMVMAKLNTAAGPNFNWKDALTTSRLADIQRIRVSIERVGDTSFRVKSAIRHLV